MPATDLTASRGKNTHIYGHITALQFKREPQI